MNHTYVTALPVFQSQVFPSPLSFNRCKNHRTHNSKIQILNRGQSISLIFYSVFLHRLFQSVGLNLDIGRSSDDREREQKHYFIWPVSYVTYVGSPIIENLVQSAALLHALFRRKLVTTVCVISHSELSRVCVWYANYSCATRAFANSDASVLMCTLQTRKQVTITWQGFEQEAPF